MTENRRLRILTYENPRIRGTRNAMRELSLFTGAGGGLLGTHLLGWTPCGYVEFNSHCQKAIAKRIKDGFLPVAPIFTDVREFVQSGAAEQYRGIAEVVTAGFPCQPFSTAGKQQAENDERNMWPATRDVIRLVRPKSILLENVPGLLTVGYIYSIFADLAQMGFMGRWGVLSAAETGAPHKRERFWIVAHSESERHRNGREARNILKANGRQNGQVRGDFGGTSEQSENVADAKKQLCDGVNNNAREFFGNQSVPEFRDNGGAQDVADAISVRLPGQGQHGYASDSTPCRDRQTTNALDGGWWENDPADVPESGMGRVVNGVAHRMVRLKAIGNGQVPAVVRLAWETLA